MKLCLLTGALIFAAQCIFAQANCDNRKLAVLGDFGSVDFVIELADEPAERTRGLMQRRGMDVSAGMLFVFDQPKAVTFWMKNTLIPLDMIFADKNGIIQHIHMNAVPLDETPISGGDGIYAVLEINGGLSSLHKFKEGDVLKHCAFESWLDCCKASVAATTESALK